MTSEPREAFVEGRARLSELARLSEAAHKVEEGVPLSPALDQALLQLTEALGKDVLLVERFDRQAAGGRLRGGAFLNPNATEGY